MSATLITNLIYVVVFIGTLIVEHFGFVPAGTANIVVAGILGHAVGTGTLMPKAASNTAVPSQGNTTPTNSTTNTRG